MSIPRYPSKTGKLPRCTINAKSRDFKARTVKSPDIHELAIPLYIYWKICKLNGWEDLAKVFESSITNESLHMS